MYCKEDISVYKTVAVLSKLHMKTWFLPICQNQIQKLFKDFQASYK